MRRMPCTCRRIFSRASATGGSRSIRTSRPRAPPRRSKEAADQLHAMDYEVYAYLQLGQDARAKAVIDDMMTVPVSSETFLAAAYALAASPARYAVERGDWKAAAALEVRPSAAASHHGDLVVRQRAWRGSVRRRGAGSGGDRAARDVAGSVAGEEGRLLVRAGRYSVADRDRLDAIAMGHQEEALKTMSDAADAEDKTEKHPVTPGQLTPARELYGAMLLQAGKPAEALAAFEATMRKEPNRLNATLGAANAAAAAGDSRQGEAILRRRDRAGIGCERGPARDREGARVPGECEITMAMMAEMRTSPSWRRSGR